MRAIPDDTIQAHHKKAKPNILVEKGHSRANTHLQWITKHSVGLVQHRRDLGRPHYPRVDGIGARMHAPRRVPVGSSADARREIVRHLAVLGRGRSVAQLANRIRVSRACTGEKCKKRTKRFGPIGALKP